MNTILRYSKGGSDLMGMSQKKEWLQIAGLALGAASSIFGGAKSAQAAADAQSELDAQKARENAWFARRYNESYVDTAAGRAAINQAKEYARETWKKASGASAVAGGTDAAVAQAKNAGNQMVGNVISNLAAQDTQRRDNAEAAHMARQDNYSAQQRAIDQQRANGVASAASGMSNALVRGASLLGGDGSMVGSGSGVLPTGLTADEYAKRYGAPLTGGLNV